MLKSDPKGNWSYEQISEAFDVSAVTIAKVPNAFVEHGLEVALQRKKPDRTYEHTVDGEVKAHLVALACSHPPTGRTYWSSSSCVCSTLSSSGILFTRLWS